MARPENSPMDCSRRPYFFKVFFPQLSSHQLSIPPAFREHIKGEAPGTASLRGPSGRIWSVDLVKDSSGLCFHNGWEEFVADHSIELGDFLVFRYDRKSHFTVLLFDATACEKKCAFFARPGEEAITVFEESEEDSEILVASPNGGPKSSTQKRNKLSSSSNCSARQYQIRSDHATVKKPNPSLYCNGGSPPRNSKKDTKKRYHVCSDHATTKKSKSTLCCRHARDNQHSVVSTMPRTSIATVKQKGKSRSPSSSEKASKAALRVKRGAGDKLVVRRALNKKAYSSTKSKYQSKRGTLTPRTTNKKPIKFEKSYTTKWLGKIPSDHLSWIEDIQVRRDSKALRLGSLLSQRRLVTREEVDKALAMAKSFESANPFIMIVMQEAYVYTSFYLHIPRWFIEEHISMESAKMTLWDTDGKPWPVIYNTYRNCGRFGGGWGKFSFAHNLEQHDVCVFELIETNQMKVHIFRVVEELAPLIRVVKHDCRS